MYYKGVNIMKEILADYYVPSEDGSEYEKVNFSTVADQIKENENKVFISQELKNHLENIKDQEVLISNITDELNTNDSEKVASGKAITKISECLGGGTIKIIISEEEPQPQSGYTIIWINPSEEE